jgi:hypothetical protein
MHTRSRPLNLYIPNALKSQLKKQAIETNMEITRVTRCKHSHIDIQSYAHAHGLYGNLSHVPTEHAGLKVSGTPHMAAGAGARPCRAP